MGLSAYLRFFFFPPSTTTWIHSNHEPNIEKTQRAKKMCEKVMKDSNDNLKEKKTSPKKIEWYSTAC